MTAVVAMRQFSFSKWRSSSIVPSFVSDTAPIEQTRQTDRQVPNYGKSVLKHAES